MPIRVLPTQLANQIAAGEVVERPASVVKELVENSLDAGASSIEIEIDRGGHKRILIRDNGGGIHENELTLALSRHATSKLSSQDDLEHIATLGFRGEALASISSVSRLTLTSHPSDQDNAWQARASGRDMAVEVLPAAHPVGTSVEVLDLFFNTPARRKFLRSEKTEFTHIDELIKRLALSHYDVSMKLSHNGKLLRQFRAVTNRERYDKRVSGVLGNGFIKQVVQLDNQHQNMRLWGWLGLPEIARSGYDQQYFYVNGRVIRDKLIHHAIRQSFAHYLDEHLNPSFVLYLEIPPEQVDVNVHPTKHEVRFHQARLVHDYIQRVLVDVLKTSMGEPSSLSEAPTHGYVSSETQESFVSELSSEKTLYQPKSLNFQPQSRPGRKQIATQTQWLDQTHTDASGELIHHDTDVSSSAVLRPLQLIESRYLLVGDQVSQMALLDLALAWQLYNQQRFLEQWAKGLVRAPLLLPQKIKLESSAQQWVSQHLQLFEQLGFLLRGDQMTLVLMEVPSCLRRANHQNMIAMLAENCARASTTSIEDPNWCCQQLAKVGSLQLSFNWSAALGIYQQVLDPQTGYLPESLLFAFSGEQLLEIARK
ncbi:MAG: DNA mismatch repair protein MutL [Candidatus Celerinatantimonas neptuna]|nr:MAG: DNA mismatch repair protein MutL [Candidatus Celerinatantimonas neptuna]